LRNFQLDWQQLNAVNDKLTGKILRIKDTIKKLTAKQVAEYTVC
jgi:hypothetical protein